MNSYLAYNIDNSIRKKSSSGGLFYSLSKYILDNNGIVFGAAWNNDWLVDMCYVNKLDDLPKLMGSKYIPANIKNTFKECKEFLDAGKLVLYTGLPCQLHGLKKFLNKNYDNLYLVDIACHGTMPVQVWKDYLKTIKRPNADIISINFRLKEPDWNNFAFEVKYSDGKVLKEHHRKNKYMQAFLSDKYLKNSCYDCKFKNSFSIADINIGDAWGQSIVKDTKNGVSFIKCYTNKGIGLLNKIDSLKVVKFDYNNMPNGCLKNKLLVKQEIYNKSIFKKKVGIVTLNLHENIGGILQAFALQTKINSLGYDCEVITWKDSRMLTFVNKNMKIKLLNSYKDYNQIKESDYDIIITGSDQIWRKQFIAGNFKENYLFYPFLGFTNNWQITRASYAASIGVTGDSWEFNSEECSKINEMLKYFNGITVRELQSVEECKTKFKLTNIDQAVDPTMLLSMEQYTKLCSKITENKIDIFAYFLDINSEKTKELNKYAETNGLTIKINKNTTIEDWLASFRDAKYIITDSFHGCMFSIIFNKPFICLYNKWRGGARFDSLITLLNNNENIIYSIGELINKKFRKYNYQRLSDKIIASTNYLTNVLAEPPVKMLANSSIYPPKPKPIVKISKPNSNKSQNYLYF